MASVCVNRLVAAVVVMACSTLVACSSSKATPSPPVTTTDSGLDATSPPVMDGAVPPADANGMTNPGDTGTKETACTAGPFYAFAATLTALDASGTTQPLGGAKIGFTTCPGFLLTTDGTGKAATQITQGLALSPIFSGGASLISGVGAEIPATGDVSIGATLFGLDVAPAIPGFGQDGGNAPVIAISLQADPAATAPCNDTTGVTLAVSGHAEATVSYANAGWPANPAVTTTSSTGPYVFLGGIQGATKVAVTGAKFGCTVTLATSAQTGKFLLVPSSVTVGVATVSN
jgi:hypothetical protein